MIVRITIPTTPVFVNIMVKYNGNYRQQVSKFSFILDVLGEM